MDKKIVAQIVEIIILHKKVEKIVIFGSRANGNYKNTSDIDIAVFAIDWTSRDINIVKDKLNEMVKTPLKFDLVNFYNIKKKSLRENILKYGKIIYER